MPVKVNMHDNTSQVDVAVKSSSKAPTSPSNNTLADKRLYLLIDKEKQDRIEADEVLQKEIDEFAANSGDGKSIELNSEDKLQIKDFDTAEAGHTIIKQDDGTIGWTKLMTPSLDAEHLEGEPDDEMCLFLELN